jgi:hypothetical protein
MSRIFVDSAAFIALHSATDRYAGVASNVYRRLVSDKRSLVTTNLVVAETCNLLNRLRNGYRITLDFRDFLAASGTAYVPGDLPALLPQKGIMRVYSTPSLERRAWEIFAKYDTARFSFTDCVSFAVMEALSIKQAFTFDEHYDVLGFERLPK